MLIHHRHQESKSKIGVPDFQFINSIASEPGVSSKSKSTVRKHVMRRFHQDKVRGTSKPPIPKTSLGYSEVSKRHAPTQESSPSRSLNRRSATFICCQHWRHYVSDGEDYQGRRLSDRLEERRDRQFLQTTPSEISILTNELNSRNRRGSPGSFFSTDFTVTSRSLQIIHHCMSNLMPGSVHAYCSRS
jgi:hypothetical protein